MGGAVEEGEAEWMSFFEGLRRRGPGGRLCEDHLLALLMMWLKEALPVRGLGPGRSSSAYGVGTWNRVDEISQGWGCCEVFTL